MFTSSDFVWLALYLNPQGESWEHLWRQISTPQSHKVFEKKINALNFKQKFFETHTKELSKKQEYSKNTLRMKAQTDIDCHFLIFCRSKKWGEHSILINVFYLDSLLLGNFIQVLCYLF